MHLGPSISHAPTAMEKSATKAGLCKVLVLGMLLYVLDVGLHVTIGSMYLDMRSCHRGLQYDAKDFNLSGLVSLDQPQNLTSDAVLDAAPNNGSLSSPFASFINKQLYVRVRNKLISLVPKHWVERISEVVSFQVKDYAPSHLAKLCTFNERKFNSTVAIALFMCENALTPDQRTVVERALSGLDAETEDRVVSALAGGNTSAALAALPRALGIDVPEKAVSVLTKFSGSLSSSDVESIAKVFQDKEVQANLPALFEALGNIDPKDIEMLGKAFGKVQSSNLPRVQELLDRLNISLAGFISDPGLLVKFIRDPEKGKILVEVQGLLPSFAATDLNSLFKIKKTFDQSPGSGLVLERLLGLPISVMLKLLSVRLSGEDVALLKPLTSAFERPEIKSLLTLAQDLDLLSASGRQKVLSSCSHLQLHVKCVDPSVDLCPQGHLLYGLSTLAALALPGAAFAISEFFHFKAFRFGSLFGQMYGQSWNGAVKGLLLPLYIIAMIPLKFVITVMQYYRVMKKMFLQRQPSKIQLAYDDALNLHSLEASLNSFLQIVIQIYFMLLLVAFGTGTFIEGVDIVDFFTGIVPLSVASICVSAFNLASTTWRLQALDHRVKGLPSRCPRSLGAVSFFAWFLSWTWAKTFSFVLMSCLTWLELFSGRRTAKGLVLDASLLPIAILMASSALNGILHRIFVSEDDPYSVAHSMASDVFPSRYLHRSDRSRTRKFLVWNHVVGWSAHVGAWLVYSLVMLGSHDDDAAILRILPIILAVVSVGPFFGAVHWAKAIFTSYGSERIRKDEEKQWTRMRMRPLFVGWQMVTVVSRLASLALLVFVYFDHWLEVNVGDSIKIALVEMVPFLLLIVVANVGLQMGMMGRSSMANALLSVLLPNGFSNGCSRAGAYIILNMALNIVLQLVLWLILTFYCWPCTALLSLSKLMSCFPVAVALWLVALVLTAFAWRICIRQSLEEQRSSSQTAIQQKPRAETTKF